MNSKQPTEVAMSADCDVTLSIANTNNRELLRRCLETVVQTVKQVRYEVIVVDNASDDGSADMVVRLISAGEADLECHATGLWCLPQSSHRAGSGSLRADPQRGHGDPRRRGGYHGARSRQDAGPRRARMPHIDPDRTLQHSCFNFPTLTSELFEAIFPYTLIFPNSRIRSRMYWWRHDEPRDVDIVVCCMLVPKAVIDRIGAFDPTFFVYSEEHDWCRRMNNAELVKFIPNAEMIHYGGQTSKRMSLHMALVKLDSQTKFFKKHHGSAQTLALRTIIAFGAAARTLGWGVLMIRGRSRETANAKFTKNWSSLKFVATGKK